MKKHFRSFGARAMLAAAAPLCLASIASAADITGRDVTLKYSVIDAGRVDGATLLLQRIEVAAARVCARLDHGDLASRSRRRACEQQLTAAAVTQVNSPVLADVYRAARRDHSRVVALAR